MSVRGRLSRLSVLGSDFAMAVADRFRGLDTQASVYQREWDGESAPYIASGWRFLTRILSPADVGADDVFLDVGCGKGRVLIVAAERYRFRRVIGVDFNTGLLEIARANLRRRGVDGVDLVHADVREWTIPDDVTVVYLFYPFLEGPARRFLERVSETLERRPRRLRLLLAGPFDYRRLFADAGFESVRVIKGHCLELLEHRLTVGREGIRLRP